MKKMLLYMIVMFAGILAMANMNGCAPTTAVASESGATLWGENCYRCHNTPSPADFSDAQWEVIGMHMKNRASLTTAETEKIVEFLKSAN